MITSCAEQREYYRGFGPTSGINSRDLRHDRHAIILITIRKNIISPPKSFDWVGVFLLFFFSHLRYFSALSIFICASPCHEKINKKTKIVFALPAACEPKQFSQWETSKSTPPPVNIFIYSSEPAWLISLKSFAFFFSFLPLFSMFYSH